MKSEHVLIASNPTSGDGSRAELVGQLKTALTDKGFLTEIVTDLQELARRADELSSQGRLRAVVSAGGDGTAAALANLLPSTAAILIFPLGTENLLSKYLGLTADVSSAVSVITANRQISIDVGRANGRLFLVMLSIGFDAAVVRQMSQQRKGHISRFSYARPILHALRQYRFPRLQMRLPGAESVLPIHPAWCFIFNIPRYAAALDFCPQADPSDGQLDLCTFNRGGLLHGIGYLARLALGRHQSLAGFSHQTCSGLEITCGLDRSGREVADIPFQIDGDPGGILPLRVEVLPSRLRLLTAP